MTFQYIKCSYRYCLSRISFSAGDALSKHGILKNAWSLHKWMKVEVKWDKSIAPLLFLEVNELWVDCKFNDAIMFSNIWSNHFQPIVLFLFVIDLGRRHAKVIACAYILFLLDFVFGSYYKETIRNLAVCWFYFTILLLLFFFNFLLNILDYSIRLGVTSVGGKNPTVASPLLTPKRTAPKYDRKELAKACDTDACY